MFLVTTISCSVPTWMSGSVLMAHGIKGSHALGILIGCNFLVGLLSFMTGLPGRKWHIAFPLTQKACWGLRGYYLVLIHRMLVSPFLIGAQMYYGAQSFASIIRAAHPNPLHDHKTRLFNVTVIDIVSRFVFVSFCFLLSSWRPERIVFAFGMAMFVSIPTIIAIIGFFVATHREHFPWNMTYTAPPPPTSHKWTLITGIWTCVKAMSMSALVQSNFTRFYRDRRSHVPPVSPWFWRPLSILVGNRGLFFAQAIVTPLCSIAVAVGGMLCMDAVRPANGPGVSTNPLSIEPFKLLDTQRLEPSHISDAKYRAIAFAGGFAFTITQLCFIVSNLGVSAGLDLATAFPTWFTIPGGMRITLFVAAGLTFLTPSDTTKPHWARLDYAQKNWPLFMGPYIGILLADYLIVHKRNYKLEHLYQVPANKRNVYWYSQGFNWRAIVAYLIPVVAFGGGFIRGLVDRGFEPQHKVGWEAMQLAAAFAPIVGGIISGAVYAVLSFAVPDSCQGEAVLDDGEVLWRSYSNVRERKAVRLFGIKKVDRWVRKTFGFLGLKRRSDDAS